MPSGMRRRDALTALKMLQPGSERYEQAIEQSH